MRTPSAWHGRQLLSSITRTPPDYVVHAGRASGCRVLSVVLPRPSNVSGCSIRFSSYDCVVHLDRLYEIAVDTAIL